MHEIYDKILLCLTILLTILPIINDFLIKKGKKFYFFLPLIIITSCIIIVFGYLNENEVQSQSESYEGTISNLNSKVVSISHLLSEKEYKDSLRFERDSIIFSKIQESLYANGLAIDKNLKIFRIANYNDNHSEFNFIKNMSSGTIKLENVKMYGPGMDPTIKK